MELVPTIDSIEMASAEKGEFDGNPLVDQVSKDLLKVISTAGSIKNRLRLISEKMEINKKTLIRVCQKRSKPNYVTVFKIYRFILNEVDDARVLELCPAVVKEYLLKANPQTFEKSASYTANIDKELHINPIFAEIYVLCSTGPVSESEISKRFGTYGLNLLKRMITLNAIAVVRKGHYVLGLNQANMRPETILTIGTQMIASCAKPENAYVLDQNIMGFYAEGLNEEAYLKWLRIDQEAITKKIELAKLESSKGEKRAFTFSLTDTLEAKGTDL